MPIWRRSGHPVAPACGAVAHASRQPHRKATWCRYRTAAGSRLGSFIILQLESCLGWAAVPERLAGFLRDKYKTERPEMLSFRYAWRAIESLFGRGRPPRVKGSPWAGL
jgi:hypothetical protein